MKYLSFARWPKGTCCDDKSCDMHDSQEAAEAATKLLKREGFGGEGKIFPLYTWVSPSTSCQFNGTNICFNDLTEIMAQIKASNLSNINSVVAKAYILGAMDMCTNIDKEKMIETIDAMIDKPLIK